MEQFSDIDKLAVSTIRLLCADIVQKPKSGHPGAPMGMAPMAHTLFSRVLKFDPHDPAWINRDRFVLSNGHASSLIYSMLHLCQYGITEDELQTFRSYGSRLAGHPESLHVPGVEVTTGPLGNGISAAVGLAIAEKHLAATYNKPNYDIFNSNVFVFCGDGCLQEGVASEACSLAGTLGLDNLIVLYDDNGITIDGPTTISFSEDVKKRFEAYGWDVQSVENGDSDMQSILQAIERAKSNSCGCSSSSSATPSTNSCGGKPHLIAVHTTIGFGAKLQGTSKVHGSPLGEEDIERLKGEWGFDPKKKYFIPEEVKKFYSEKVVPRAQSAKKEWDALFAKYCEEYKAEGEALQQLFIKGDLPAGWRDALPKYKPESEGGKPEATRKSSELVMAALAEKVPQIVGGSADLLGSTLASVKGSPIMKKGDFSGRNIAFGIREHAMCAIGNGIASFCKGYIPFVSTFLVFAPYAFGAIRLSALSHLRVLFVFTHDSIGVGEDGPTHQPIETLTQLRALPNLLVMRPADGKETAGAYATAVRQDGRSTVFALSRQNLPQLEGSKEEEGVEKGAYVVYQSGTQPAADAQAPFDGQSITILSTGSEVHLSIEAAKLLASSVKSVRVVSVPCMELFREQPATYRASILGCTCNAPCSSELVMSVEAGLTNCWCEFSHCQMGINTFGVSCPEKHVYNHFHLTPEGIRDRAMVELKLHQGKFLETLVLE
ncbi:transketolase [Monocercomonoides exilis]|uniref:transketolase n=1 Tax=Monocercomonoides exilis TaxID=2049356 RepID=UPI0035599E38|nr:transketolase [Monocercomonoides exilis]|eukprot:MONOS_3866.1-p1 / transcript=MONOS_3866.1 / gene=MONOS_3866 / organism=Monocercomonoides_exilis_PA203 / gene_product=transketolase / transcript_product=transketolase / location=Mono_scaffold00095:49757-52034(-) / protein_length=717 / sequence_SO=supercontig / SO=protein_coding / is_pseudo=false